MTTHRSFKRLVRARMEKTGESYTAARAMLLAADGAGRLVARDVGRGDPRADRPRLGGVVRPARRVGRSTEHREIARRIAAELGIDPLAWNAQAITMSYERTRGLRVAGQRADGFAVTAQKTVPVPVERLFDAFVAQPRRAARAHGHEAEVGPLRLGRRTTAAVNVTFVAKGDASSTVAVEHARLADAEEAERMKAFWRERLSTLKAAALDERPRRDGRRPFVSGGAYYAVFGSQLPDGPAEMPPWKLAVELLRCLDPRRGRRRARRAGRRSTTLDRRPRCSALVLWIGFPLVLWVGAVIHENTPVKLAAIHGGDWLLKLLLIGTIVAIL